ncbi:MAG: hypothetical protein NC187_10040 [Candidatus Amulumruptor caecigallinarius]|nr:hypothetical protein [Candidatus Amulumruptor caecigallinarius]MCM1397806.1 hypothetical protein [Candidatus Amulumruptor caecigallinarius]MCM1454851.1 hypothetical protein [bacterium]
MKSLKYMSLVALVAGLTACSQYEEPNPATPVTPQETVISSDGVKVEASQYVLPNEETGDLADLDLDAYSKLGFDIPMATVDINHADFPASYDLTMKMFLADNEDFNNAVTVPCTINSANQVVVTPADFQQAYVDLFGRKHDTKEVWVRFAAYASDGQITNLRLGGSDVYFAESHFFLTSVDLGINIEDAYYLVGAFNGWSPDADQLIKLAHSDKDTADDPIFTYYVDYTTGDGNWKVIPESAIDWAANTFDWGQAWGCEVDGSTEMEGALIEGGNAAKLPSFGKWVIVINMESAQYHYSEAYENIHVTGAGNDWTVANPPLLEPNAAYTWYEGLAFINGEFKFTIGNWDLIDWGTGDGDGVLAAKGGNIAGPSGADAGIYYVQMSPIFLQYEVGTYKIDKLGAIGEFNSWGESANMTPNDDYTIWTATGVNITAGQQFKIRANDDWAWSIGGNSTTDLIFKNADNPDPANIVAPNSGTKITLDLSKVPFSITIE